MNDKLLTALAESLQPNRDDIVVWRFAAENGGYQITVQLGRSAQGTHFNVEPGMETAAEFEFIRAQLAVALEELTRRIPGEMNPSHPVTAGLRDQWHKIVALVLLHFNTTEVILTLDEIMEFAKPQPDGERFVVAHDRGDRLELRMLSQKEAEKYARESGALLL